MRLLLALSCCSPSSSRRRPPSRKARRAATGEALFVVSGRGWGHGVGMSQWAPTAWRGPGTTTRRSSRTTTTGPRSAGRARSRCGSCSPRAGARSPCRRRSRSLSSTGTGREHRLAAGALQLEPGLVFRTETGSRATASPLTVRPGKASTLAFDGRLFRGQLEVAVEKGFLRVVNASRSRPTCRASSPARCRTRGRRRPCAQAVAARSYALATKVEGKPFDLYSDVRSQVYLGVAGEKPRTTEAVRATTGEVVLYGGRVATTYYFSTSGGRTASAADVFGFSVPYLVSAARPVGQGVPVPPLGPGVARRAHRPVEARPRSPRARRLRRADSVRARPVAASRDDRGRDERTGERCCARGSAFARRGSPSGRPPARSTPRDRGLWLEASRVRDREGPALARRSPPRRTAGLDGRRSARAGGGRRRLARGLPDPDDPLPDRDRGRRPPRRSSSRSLLACSCRPPASRRR